MQTSSIKKLICTRAFGLATVLVCLLGACGGSASSGHTAAALSAPASPASVTKMPDHFPAVASRCSTAQSGVRVYVTYHGESTGDGWRGGADVSAVPDAHCSLGETIDGTQEVVMPFPDHFPSVASRCSMSQSGVRLYVSWYDNTAWNGGGDIAVTADPGCP